MESNIIGKLKLDKYQDVLILNKPKDVDYFDKLLFNEAEGAYKYDCIIVFITTLVEMKRIIYHFFTNDKLKNKGKVFFAYPKKGNKKGLEFIERDSIFPYLGVDEEDGYVVDTTYKFIRMVSLDDTYTIVGISNEVKRVERSKTSQRVADYVELIPQLIEQLDKEAMAIFEQLTPGYQKDWTRYVYSAKSEATRTKRLQEATDILKQGYKSITLFRAAKK